MTTARQRPLLLPRDAAKLLSVSPSTLKRMVAAGRLPAPVQLSERRIAYRPEDLDRLIGADSRGGR